MVSPVLQNRLKTILSKPIRGITPANLQRRAKGIFGEELDINHCKGWLGSIKPSMELSDRSSYVLFTNTLKYFWQGPPRIGTIDLLHRKIKEGPQIKFGFDMSLDPVSKDRIAEFLDSIETGFPIHVGALDFLNIPDLHPDWITAFTRDNVGNIEPNQLKKFTLKHWRMWSPEQIGAFLPEVFRIITDQIKILSPEQVRGITDEQFKLLGLFQLEVFDPSQFEYLGPKKAEEFFRVYIARCNGNSDALKSVEKQTDALLRLLPQDTIFELIKETRG